MRLVPMVGCPIGRRENRTNCDGIVWRQACTNFLRAHRPLFPAQLLHER
jgi:hypothetical protein